MSPAFVGQVPCAAVDTYKLHFNRYLPRQFSYRPQGALDYGVFPDHQIAASPPNPQSNKRVTARAPLWL